MRFTSPSRRALGLLAVSTIGMSTAVLGIAGVASAAPTPTFSFSSANGSAVTVPSGICAIDVQVVGAAGGSGSGSDGRRGGRLAATGIGVDAGDVLHLYVGTAGGDVTVATGGSAGLNADPDDADGEYDGLAGGTDGSAYSGGGGAASSIVVAGDVIASAFGGDGGFAGLDEDADFVDGSGGGGGYNYADTDAVYDDEATSHADPMITGTGVACVADAPYLNFVNPGNGSATLFFAAPQSDNGIPVTGYEVTTDGGDTWTSLSTTPDGGALRGTISGLVNETTYTVAVRAVGGTENTLKGAESVRQTVTPYVPLAAPTNVSITTTTSRVTISWTAPAGQVKGYDIGIGAGESGGQGCATAPSVTTCTFFAPAGTGYDIGVRAIDMQDRPGLYASQAGVTVPGPATPASVPTQDNGDITGPAGAISKLSAGQKVTLQGSGYAPNSTVQLLVFSSPVSLGTVVTDSSGSFSVEVTVPANLANGTHHLVATGIDANGAVRNLVVSVTVSGGVATLATTGFDAVPVAVGGAMVLLAGGGLLVGSRRRSTNA